VTAVHLVVLDAQALACVAARPMVPGTYGRRGRYFVCVSGQAWRGHGSRSALESSSRSRRLASAASSEGTSW
jgi:hypothetical protein